MSKNERFISVWDAIEDDAVRRENLKLRAALMMEITERLKDRELTQTQAAEVLHITQPRVSALLKGKIGDFRLDSLVDMAHRLGMHVSFSVAA
jgi:predicted XRE-type DNA-binding protein